MVQLHRIDKSHLGKLIKIIWSEEQVYDVRALAQESGLGTGSPSDGPGK